MRKYRGHPINLMDESLYFDIYKNLQKPHLKSYLNSYYIKTELFLVFLPEKDKLERLHVSSANNKRLEQRERFYSGKNRERTKTYHPRSLLHLNYYLCHNRSLSKKQRIILSRAIHSHHFHPPPSTPILSHSLPPTPIHSHSLPSIPIPTHSRPFPSIPSYTHPLPSTSTHSHLLPPTPFHLLPTAIYCHLF